MDNVTVIRSLKRTSVSIHVRPNGSVVIKMPKFYWGSVGSILKKYETWIADKQRQLMLQKQERAKTLTEGFLYLGKRYPLEIRHEQKEIIEVADKLYIAVANKARHSTYLTTWYKQQARKVIVDRVYAYAKLSGDTFRSISITSAETRWGSCSSQKTLNFNWRLIMAPLEVIDYVVVHELSHLEEMNHSKAFWERVRKLSPLYRQHRTWLKRNGELLRVE